MKLSRIDLIGLNGPTGEHYEAIRIAPCRGHDGETERQERLNGTHNNEEASMETQERSNPMAGEARAYSEKVHLAGLEVIEGPDGELLVRGLIKFPNGILRAFFVRN